MKNSKDPYNFERIDGYLKERKKEIGEKKQMYGKIYQKSPKAKSNGSGEQDQ